MSKKKTTSYFHYYSLAEFEMLKRFAASGAYGIQSINFVPAKSLSQNAWQAILEFKDEQCQDLAYMRLLLVRKQVDAFEKMYRT